MINYKHKQKTKYNQIYEVVEVVGYNRTLAGR